MRDEKTCDGTVDFLEELPLQEAFDREGSAPGGKDLALEGVRADVL